MPIGVRVIARDICHEPTRTKTRWGEGGEGGEQDQKAEDRARHGK